MITMIQRPYPISFVNSSVPSFCGYQFVIRKAKNYAEKFKVSRNADLAITDNFYKLYQQNWPKWFRSLSQKIENFLNLITMFPTSFRNADVLCVVDKDNKIVGGVFSEKINRRYHVFNLYLDESVKKTKEVPQILKEMIIKIKARAKEQHINFVSCQVYDRALPLIRLYKKAGFREVEFPPELRKLNVIDMETTTKELGETFVRRN